MRTARNGTPLRDGIWAKATFELEATVFEQFRRLSIEQGISPKRLAQLGIFLVLQLDDLTRAEGMRLMSGGERALVTVQAAPAPEKKSKK